MTAGWLDIHGHFNTPEEEVDIQRLAERDPTVRNFKWSPEWNLDHMDRTGIALQLLSNGGPQTADAMRKSNAFGAALVAERPDRFGLLASVPMHDPEQAVAEIRFASENLNADGFYLQSNYDGLYLGNPQLEPVWAEFDRIGAGVFIHPKPFGPEVSTLSLGRSPSAIEVAFDLARSVTDMLYAAIFRRYRHMKILLAHAGGALPAVSPRVARNAEQSFVYNPHDVTQAEIFQWISEFYYETGQSGNPRALAPVLECTTPDHVVYGTDFGALCTNDGQILESLAALRSSTRMTPQECEAVGRNGLAVFPRVRPRLETIGARIVETA